MNATAPEPIQPPQVNATAPEPIQPRPIGTPILDLEPVPDDVPER